MDYNNILLNVVVPLITKFGALRYIERGGTATSPSDEWIKGFDTTLGSYYWQNQKTGAIVYDEPKETKKLYPVLSVQDDLSEEDYSNSLIQSSDLKFYIAPQDIVPVVGDVFIDGEKRFNIYYVEVLKPANLTVLYTIYCRVI